MRATEFKLIKKRTVGALSNTPDFSRQKAFNPQNIQLGCMSHRLGKYHRRINDIISREGKKHSSFVSEAVEAQRKGNPDAFPYPVFKIEWEYGEGALLHIIPLYERDLVQYVEKNGTVQAEVPTDRGFWYDDYQLNRVLENIVEEVAYTNAEKSELFMTLEEIIEDNLREEFSPALEKKLHSPITRCVIENTETVTARRRKYGETVQTDWHITFSPEAQKWWRAGDKRLSTDDIVNPDAQKFQLSPRPYIDYSSWFRISQYWLRQVEIESSADKDQLDVSSEHFEWCQATSGNWHLRSEQGDHGCHTTPKFIETKDFNLYTPPVTEQICSHCRSTYQRLYFSETI